MASEERLLNLGRLQEKEQQARLLAIKIHRLKDEIRRETDPHRRIEDLNVTALRVALEDLGTANARYEQLLSEIAALREDLGLPRYEH
ncbi:hypothetical protein [Candidatus Nitrospira bockiana]